MNIFILNDDPVIAAKEQCDKHVVKMIVESAQMLSTAHRMLDGVMDKRRSKSGKTMSKYRELPDAREGSLYKAVHKLNDIDKALIFLYLEDKPYKEISETLGISSVNARVKMNRAKEKLKNILNP